MSRILERCAVVAMALLPIRAHAQHPSTILDSYTKAHQLVEAAVAAHGGIEALNAARQLRLTARGYEYHPHQSRRVAPPFDSTVADYVLMTDIARGRVIFSLARPRGSGKTPRT